MNAACEHEYMNAACEQKRLSSQGLCARERVQRKADGLWCVGPRGKFCGSVLRSGIRSALQCPLLQALFVVQPQNSLIDLFLVASM